MAILLLAGFRPGYAQQGVTVLLETNLPGATVYADSLRLGPASRGTFVVPPGTREVRLVPAAGDVWSIDPVKASLSAHPGDTLALRLPFPHYYRIETVPFGASVYVETLDGKEAVGATPVLYKSPRVPEGRFVVERRGYETERLMPGNDVWNRYVLTLKPVMPEETTSAEVAWNPPARRQRWIDYTAAAVALGAGALAVYYKFEADRLDDRYSRTGDPALREAVKANDTRSMIALGVMQAGVGVLAVRFILR